MKCGIIGEGPEKEDLIELTKHLKLEQNINFMGHLENYEDLIKTMKLSKVFAFPSTREGFGIVIIEANACGLPVIGVISENSMCVSEIIKEGKNGFLLDKLDENVFADKIITLLKNDDLRRKMSKNGQRFSVNYDWNNITDKIEKFYSKIIKK